MTSDFKGRIKIPPKIQIKGHRLHVWLKEIRNSIEKMKGITHFPILSLVSLSSGGDFVKLEATFCPAEIPIGSHKSRWFWLFITIL